MLGVIKSRCPRSLVPQFSFLQVKLLHCGLAIQTARRGEWGFDCVHEDSEQEFQNLYSI